MTPTLTAADARALRLASLRLTASGAATASGGVASGGVASGGVASGGVASGGVASGGVGELVRWFGAMQGQDLASVQWSLGVRLPGSTLADVEAALERREALRTWPMRGTLHLVPAEDAAWMVRILGERPLAGAVRRREALGLRDQDADRAVEVLQGLLTGGGRCTRAECVAALDAAGISGAGQRGYHLLWYASQHGVTCIAPNRGSQQTFALLREWAPQQRDLSRDEALATIALRYFRSHGPASRRDFAGWTGLTMADVRAGIGGCGDALAAVEVDGVEMLLDAGLLDAGASGLGRDAGASGLGRDAGASGLGRGAGASGGEAGLLALPGFDEYLLGYKERSLFADAAHLAAIVPGGNGVFRSTIVRGGRVIATWTRTLAAKQVRVDVLPLEPLRKADRRPVEAALAPFAAFHGRALEVRWP